MKAIKTLPTVKYAHKDETLFPSLFNFNEIQKYIIGFSFAYFPPVCPFLFSLTSCFVLSSLSFAGLSFHSGTGYYVLLPHI